jgi:hypothetical protein
LRSPSVPPRPAIVVVTAAEARSTTETDPSYSLLT